VLNFKLSFNSLGGIKIKKFYVYAHKNKINNKIFYIGGKYSKNKREFDFKIRSNLWKEEVSKIGIENVEVIILFESDNINEVRKKEVYYQQYYYKLGENYCCKEFCNYGKNNPNYQNYWTDIQKQNLSLKMKGRYKGKNNPNYNNKWSEEKKKKLSDLKKKNGLLKGKNNPKAKACILYLRDSSFIEFDTKSELIQYLINNYKTANIGYKKPKQYKISGFEKLNGIYWILKDDLNKCEETNEKQL